MNVAKTAVPASVHQASGITVYKVADTLPTPRTLLPSTWVVPTKMLGRPPALCASWPSLASYTPRQDGGSLAGLLGCHVLPGPAWVEGSPFGMLAIGQHQRPESPRPGILLLVCDVEKQTTSFRSSHLACT